MEIPDKKSFYKIFIVEDNDLYAKVLKKQLKSDNFEVSVYLTGHECLEQLNKKPAVITLDYKLPDISGDEMISEILKSDPDIHIIVISGQDDISTAVKLLKNGAYDYIAKGPGTQEQLRNSINNIYNTDKLRKENEILREAVKEKYNFRKLIKGHSREIENVFDLMEKAISTNISVSISGETGTGKELVAKGIHFNSKRKNQPFVAVNVSAIPEGLIESELFGHEKGAFTGADFKKIGKFELANGGTLFLDEIPDLDMNLQAKLLRVVQERELTRVGGTQNIPLDVRIITATHKNLQELVAQNKFRQDLYYRLLGLPIVLPPLRERGNDVILLAKYFVDEFCKDNGLKTKIISQSTKNALSEYPFPGNVRELKSVMELACVMSSGNTIESEHLHMVGQDIAYNLLATEKTMEQYVHDIVYHFLKKYNRNVNLVSDKLNIGKSTIYRLIKDYKNTTNIR